ncbi:FAD-binding domain-containing protein, partial [Aureobasidium sp. EXF-8845]
GITNYDQGSVDAASGAQRPANAASANIRPLDKSTPGVTIRIRDRGGGIPPAAYAKLWEFGFTTFNEQEIVDITSGGTNDGDGLNALSNAGGNENSLAGLGYGLKLGRAYAEYFGGGIRVQSLLGWGTDEYNARRYWGTQYSENATIVMFPTTKDDVSHAVQAASASRLGRNLAFVGGGHGQTNASSTSGFLIDLSWMNTTKILHNITLGDVNVSTAIAYSGGATWKQVTDTTSNTGFTAVGARVGDVGVGGFSSGGGIGFLAGAYGYAIDRLRALEIVLMSGKIVPATNTNEYSDLFWAIQGGGGQFGIVTTFYQEAVPEPTSSEFGIWIAARGSWEQKGYGPVSDSDTAWPHAQSAHQTLFSPALRSAVDDDFVMQHNDVLNKITHDHQASIGPFIADYPNYISPKTDGYRVWGDNVERLIKIKAKYDPQCRIHQGRVFASEACIVNGWANIYPRKG